MAKFPFSFGHLLRWRIATSGHRRIQMTMRRMILPLAMGILVYSFTFFFLVLLLWLDGYTSESYYGMALGTSILCMILAMVLTHVYLVKRQRRLLMMLKEKEIPNRTIPTPGPYLFQQLPPCTLSHVKSELTANTMLFSQAALSILPLEENSVFSWLPSPAREEWLRHETDIGLCGGPFDDAYMSFVKAFLAQHPASLIIMEAVTVYASNRDEIEELHQLGLNYRHNSRECFVYLTHEATMETVEQAQHICEALEYYAFFLSNYPEALKWKTGTEITKAEVEKVVSRCTSLAVIAYDQVGFILWTRDPDGCIRLNTPGATTPSS